MAEVKLYFHGGVGTVTGANFLLETGKLTIAVDCGLLQDGRESNEKNRAPFPYDPKNIDILFITHAHMDHIGRIPKLVRDGFGGVIYSTPETKAIAAVMLEDELSVLTKESKLEGLEPFYDENDIVRSMELWHTMPYHTLTPIGDSIQVYLRDAGHILGSAMVEFRRNNKRLVFTGDLGNTPTPLLCDTEPLEDTTYLVTESVYGDRNHENRDERRQKLAEAVNTSLAKGGVLLIPTFSLEKTQVLLHELNDLLLAQKIQKVPMYLDSPLAIKVTDIYRQMTSSFNLEAKMEIASGDDIFDFPELHRTESMEDSKAIDHQPNPKIILAGSGMSNGGRIQRHEKLYLSNPNNTILFLGYQAVGSLGRRLVEGAKFLDIGGESVAVKANVVIVSGYSSHKDSEHIVEFVEHTAKTLKKVFVVMGEPKASLFLAQRLRDYAGVNAEYPEQDEMVSLDM